jgi:hypothetical protein
VRFFFAISAFALLSFPAGICQNTAIQLGKLIESYAMTPFEFGRFVKLAVDPASTHTELSYKPSNTLKGRAQILSTAPSNAQTAASTSVVNPRYRKPDSGNIWANAERGEAGTLMNKPHQGRKQPYPTMGSDGMLEIKDPSKTPISLTQDT